MNDTKGNADSISLSQMSREVVEDQSVSTLAVQEDVEKSNTFAPEPEAGEEPPNGGFAAWLVVFGAFCVSSMFIQILIDMQILILFVYIFFRDK